MEELYKKAKLEIKDFGKKPIKDVGAIINIVQASNISEKQIVSTVQEIYIKFFVDSGRGDLNQARQSWGNASGNNFEELIRTFINDSLNPIGILAVKGDKLRKNKKAERIVEFLTLKADRRCVQMTTGVWPDSDIVLLTKDVLNQFKAFALLNCKTSDHSRNDAVLFWALALRLNNIKYCLMTQDLDNKFVRGHDDPRISALRRKAEAYLDRVYTTNTKTEECSQIKVLNFTKQDKVDIFLSELQNWRKEVVPDFRGDFLAEESLN